MIDKNELEKTARLAHLEFTAAELEALCDDMQGIIEFANEIDKASGKLGSNADAQRVLLTALRSDIPAKSAGQSAILGNSESESGMFRVKGGI
ncbi:MAG: hypothetical protein J5964_01045 [Eubacterium sp.]|nr:hypothetical protein [Eubacterium sp.]